MTMAEALASLGFDVTKPIDPKYLTEISPNLENCAGCFGEGVIRYVSRADERCPICNGAGSRLSGYSLRYNVPKPAR